MLVGSTEAEAAVVVFSGAVMEGRSLKATRNVDNLKKFIFPDEPDEEPTELDSAQQQKLTERREHKVRLSY